MVDKTETYNGSILQHGPGSDRIYLMKLGRDDPSSLILKMSRLIKENGYSKVFAKLPASKCDPFHKVGFEMEAVIPDFYNGIEPAVFLGYYSKAQRKTITNADTLDRNMIIAREKQNAGISKPLRSDAILRKCTKDDIHEMANIYKIVFPSYPFPISDPDYILETMQSHVDYFGVEIDGELVALASAEMDKEGQNAEMTDFATLPKWTGNSFAQHLLAFMEEQITEKEIVTAYTIARAESPGMNATFARLGYTFAGRLPNNTQISGKIESMNVWYKHLR